MNKVILVGDKQVDMLTFRVMLWNLKYFSELCFRGLLLTEIFFQNTYVIHCMKAEVVLFPVLGVENFPVISICGACH